MNPRDGSRDWAKEFHDFATAEERKPPVALREQVLARVRADLNPSPWRVFAKITAIQFAVGAVTLLLCPQFGISPLGHHGLMAVFMKLGHHACMFACGAFFLGSGALVASLTLARPELRLVRRHPLLQFAALGAVSIAVFLCLGAEVVASVAGLWFAGSVVGATATFELGSRARSRKLV